MVKIGVYLFSEVIAKLKPGYHFSGPLCVSHVFLLRRLVCIDDMLVISAHNAEHSF